MIVELPNGQELEFPDGTSPHIMRNAIHKNFPEYADMYKGNEQSTKEKSPDETDRDAILRYGVKDPLIGALNFGSRGSASVNNLASSLINKLGANLPKQEATDFSEMLGVPEEQKNLADKLIQFAPEISASLALPAARLGKVGDVLEMLPGWGKYLKAGLGNAISQGALAASQSPENQGKAALEAGSIAAPFSMLSEAIKSGNPTIRNIGRGLGALGAGGLGYYGAKSVGIPESGADLTALLGAALGAKGGNLERRVREDMLEGVKGTDYQDVLNAGKRLGITNLRPGEASGQPFVVGKEAGIGKSAQGAKELHEAGQKSLSEQEQSIDNLFGNIFPKSLEEQKNALYKSAEPIIIPEKALEKIKDNEIFKTAEKEVETDPVHKEALKGVAKNSIQYLNQIKIEMDKMMLGVPEGKAKTIRDTKNALTAIADKVSPEYRQGRQLAERGIVRKEIEDLFNKKDETGANLFKTLLSNKRDYSNLQNKFKRLEETASTPEQVKSMKSAQQQLEDMKLVFERLIPTPTARTAASLGRQNASQEGSLTGNTKQYLHKLLHSDKYDVAAVKLITNPKWADELDKLGEITDKDKLIAAFHSLLGKAGAQAAAQ